MNIAMLSEFTKQGLFFKKDMPEHYDLGVNLNADPEINAVMIRAHYDNPMTFLEAISNHTWIYLYRSKFQPSMVEHEEPIEEFKIKKPHNFLMVMIFI